MPESNQEVWRTYNCYRKHKGHNRFASQCPRALSMEVVQGLLEQALPEGPGHKSLYNVYRVDDSVGLAKFRLESGITYHGYPVSASEVPPDILKRLVEEGRLKLTEYQRMLKGA